MTARELYDKVKIDNLYFLATGGGIVFGGGEALLHADFYPEFKNVCGDEWRLTVETSLNAERDLLSKTVDVIDDYIVDIKDINSDIYMEYTGKSNTQVLQNLQYLLSKKDAKNVYVRVPSISNYNTEDNISFSVEYLKKLGVENIEVFSYIPESAY